MHKERLVVIGGVAAGMSAASRARRLNPRMEIVVLEKGEDVSYGACGLPFLLAGDVPDPNDLVVHSADDLREKRGLDVRTGVEVVEIIPGQRSVAIKSAGKTNDQTEQVPYDKLVIATGGAPRMDIEGVYGAGIFHCNTMASATALMRYMEERQPKTAVIVGGGYIGFEVAESLRRRGLAVHMIGRGKRLLGHLEPNVSAIAEETMRANGVELSFDTEVHALESLTDGRINVFYSENGENGENGENSKNSVAQPDLVLVATGLQPRTAMAAAAGVETGMRDAILTDDRQQTNLNGVYAAGDCTQTVNLVSGAPAYVPLGTTANKQGRVAGENAAGGNARFPGIVGTLVTKAFGLELGRTGLSSEQAQAAGFRPETVTIQSHSRARYLGGKPLWVTLVIDRESGRLLGAQLCGEEGAARRVDVAATAITNGMLLKDFVHLDLGYAPPFGPVYDPLLIAAWEGLKKIGGRQ